MSERESKNRHENEKIFIVTNKNFKKEIQANFNDHHQYIIKKTLRKMDVIMKYAYILILKPLRPQKNLKMSNY